MGAYHHTRGRPFPLPALCHGGGIESLVKSMRYSERGPGALSPVQILPGINHTLSGGAETLNCEWRW